ncbi:hypothetical protein [Legionella hackeliae]|uniref:Uncharacterized protein n=1 Tax=Legionella hackeliae TaxID=449 RepID=A0A0A8UQ47_LEGHA|nr:hypothetical protein [Legionella hackeliae]KTD09686.1 hypothetical protein Lhac_2054 [Legionella hackeliae]CEK10990.1 protein of unknown function [Legionella hackeliae]STX47730.1 Uncharacterised protein [Legionella hackeliae]
MSANELLAEIGKVIKSYDWTKEVRLNWLRDFGRNLVFFQNSSHALEFDRLSREESQGPRGINAINRFLNGTFSDTQKISGIKKILQERGYEGENKGNSWKRTDNTHAVYAQLAEMIANFENKESCYIPILL